MFSIRSVESIRRKRHRNTHWVLSTATIVIASVEAFTVSPTSNSRMRSRQLSKPTYLSVSTSTRPSSVGSFSPSDEIVGIDALNDETSPVFVNQTTGSLPNGIEATPSSMNSTISILEIPQDAQSASGLLSKIYEKIGAIDDDRYIFPEYTSGEVPRVFSTLRYEMCDKEPGKVIKAHHAAGSVLGAIALIAGTTIGAGVLALPAATAGAGFLPSTVAMFVAYGYMVVSGLLIAELQLNRIGSTGRPGTGLLDLYNSSLGGPIATVGSAAYFFLHYAMMVAYIAQGGTNIGSLLPQDLAATLPDGAGQLAFASICAATLFFANSKFIEKMNNVLVAGIVGAFLSIVASAAGTADFGALIAPENQHPEQVVNCFPILFLAFVYQSWYGRNDTVTRMFLWLPNPWFHLGRFPLEVCGKQQEH